MSAATDKWMRPVTILVVTLLFGYWSTKFITSTIACSTSFVCEWQTPLINGLATVVYGILAAYGSDLCCVMCRTRTTQHIRGPSSSSLSNKNRNGVDRVDNGVELSDTHGHGPHADMVTTTIGMVHPSDLSSSDGTWIGSLLAACEDVTMNGDDMATEARQSRGRHQVTLLMVASYLMLGLAIMVIPAMTIFISVVAVGFMLSIWCAVWIIVCFWFSFSFPLAYSIASSHFVTIEIS
jgi:hypothetical protein